MINHQCEVRCGIYIGRHEAHPLPRTVVWKLALPLANDIVPISPICDDADSDVFVVGELVNTKQLVGIEGSVRIGFNAQATDVQHCEVVKTSRLPTVVHGTISHLAFKVTCSRVKRTQTVKGLTT